MFSRYVGIAVLALALCSATAEPARAQFYNPYMAQYQMQQMQMQSYYMYNLQQMQAANAAYTASMYNPMAAGGAGGMYGGGGAGYSPYSSYYSPVAGYLFGSADVIRAEGDYTNAMEKARLLREQVEQSKLDTKKKAFELNLYIAQNTPTYAERQAMATRQVLRRVQTTTNPFEIWNGVGLNVLLDDLKKFQGMSVSVVPQNVKPDLLRQINITKGRGGNFGLFRDSGQFQWPSALQDILGGKQKTISTLADRIIRGAINDNIENGLLKDLREEIEQARTALVKKITEIPTPQYLEAKRYLRDLDDACFAIGDAKAFFEFQNFVNNKGKGRSVKEVSDYMLDNGLRFAPAVQGGDAAYTAFHTAMVTLDVAVNQQLAGAAPPVPSKDR